MTITRFGMCPGARSGEGVDDAWQRQVAVYGPLRVHRIFFDSTLMGTESGASAAARELILNDIHPSEDLVVSCKEVGSEFASRVAQLRACRNEEAAMLGVQPGLTYLIIHHEPEGDLTQAAYNTKWNTALPVLNAESSWLMPGTCHTGFWSRKVDAAGIRMNDWRMWIPTNTAVQSVLRFVSADLYPSAGRPTKAKPKYYEPAGDHVSPYTPTFTELGFCGILDEMVDELRSGMWPNIRNDLLAGIAEINHERPSTANGWPAGFEDADGSDNASWMENIFHHATEREYAFVTWFHKGGGDLLLRTPTAEATVLKDWVRETYDNTETPDPSDPQYQLGYQAGWAARQSDVDEAKANGRLEAFGETVNWASEQS